MRDPDRIDRMLALVRQLWRKHPDWRLTQLIMNAWGQNRDPYHVEDDELEVALRALLNPQLTADERDALEALYDLVPEHGPVLFSRWRDHLQIRTGNTSSRPMQTLVKKGIVTCENGRYRPT